MKLYGLKNCDTCRKALKSLETAGRSVAFVDVRKEGLNHADVSRFHAAFGANLLNTRSTTWRGLDEAERQSEPLELLLKHPALMKRPVIEKDGQLYLGWGAAVQNALL